MTGLCARRYCPGFFADLCITTDPEEFCTFMGLDLAAHKRGFQTDEDCFKWLSESRFFSKSLLDNLTYKETKRKVKKDMLRAYFDWLHTQQYRAAEVKFHEKFRFSQTSISNFETEFLRFTEENSWKWHWLISIKPKSGMLLPLRPPTAWRPGDISTELSCQN
jgi:hypothetical protein